MTTQIRQVIAKVTGEENFEKHLSVITGHVQTIDKEFYKSAIDKVQTFFERFILPEILKLSELEAANIDKLYRKLDLNKLYVDKQKKGGKVIQKLRLRPKDIYESDWFKRLREIETSGVKFCKQFNITKLGMTDQVKEVVNNNLSGARLFKFLGRTILEDCTYSGTGELKVIAGAFAIREFCKKITEIILSPMYDVHKYMENHWQDQISKVLNTKLAAEVPDKPYISDDDVRGILYDYVLFTYRLELTGSPAELTKILKKNMKFSQLEDITASQLATIVEKFNLESVGESATKMQSLTIETLKELDKADTDEDISKTFSGALNKIYNIFVDTKKEEVEEKETPEGDLPEDVFA